jgi:ABC-type transporter Mla maintaining outer membrane lipid asymmetry permease subunit MlaE
MISIITESGPIITGLVVSGRVGAGIGAALGSMKVTDQIDAMEVSGVNPYRYLAATRIVACVLMLPLLTLAAVLRKKYIRRSGMPFLMPQFSPAGIRDADRREWMS